MLTREQMAMRVARELRDGYYVNLGIGIPTLVANYIPDGIDVMLQSENGLLGMGAFPTEDELDADMINAGKQTVTARKGAAMVAGAENIIVVMTHASKSGESKLLPDCTLPLTGAGCIKRVLTDLALLEIADGAFILRERAPGISVAEIIAKTAGKLFVPEHVPEMQFN